MERTDQLMERAEHLKQQLERVVKVEDSNQSVVADCCSWWPMTGNFQSLIFTEQSREE